MEYLLFIILAPAIIIIVIFTLLLIFWKPLTQKIQEEKTTIYKNKYKVMANTFLDEQEKRKKED